MTMELEPGFSAVLEGIASFSRIHGRLLLCTCVFISTAGAATFLETPPAIVYVPPAGFGWKEVRCTTREASTIRWVYTTGDELDETTYNITATSNRSSTMRLSLLDQFLSVSFLTTPVRCHAGNHTSSEFRFALGVLRSPLSGNPVDVIVSEGMDVHFTCSYNLLAVLPPPTAVTWLFVSQSGNQSEILNETGPAQSQIRRLQLTDVTRFNAGTYKCVIKNEFGMISSLPGMLTVEYFDGFNLTVTPAATVRFGMEVTFNIIVSALPAATEIRLSRSDGPFFSSSNSNVNRPLGTVTVNDTNRVQYKFTADASWNGSITVYVLTPTHNETSSTTMTVELDRPGAISVSAIPLCFAGNLLVHWTTSGNGGSEITSYTLRWRKSSTGSTWPNKRTLMVSRYGSLTQQGGNHTLTELENGTLYDIQIEATNGIGSRVSDTVSKMTLSVAHRPSLVHLSSSENSLLLGWSVGQNGGAEILHYTVTWSTDASLAVETKSLSLSVSAYANLTQEKGRWRLTGLTKGTEYYTNVDANNCVGSSISAVQICSTRCNPGRSSLPMIHKEAISQSSFQLVIRAPSERNCGQITEYIVRDSNHTRLTTTYSVANGNVTIIVKGLEAGRRYAVQVYAVNNRSWEGPPSEQVTVETEAAASSEGGLSTAVTIAIIVVSVVVAFGIVITITCCCRSYSHKLKPVFTRSHSAPNNRDPSPKSPCYMSVSLKKFYSDEAQQSEAIDSNMPTTAETNESDTKTAYIPPNLPEEECPPAEESETPVVYLELDPCATLNQDTPVRNHVYDELTPEVVDENDPKHSNENTESRGNNGQEDSMV